MLRKLTKRITNNFGLKILAAVFAIILWMVVVNIEDPEKTKGFTIPVTIENNEYLSDMGKTYEILNNTDKISFTVTGKRSIIEELSESDFTAVANLENINDDMTTIPVSVSASKSAPSDSASLLFKPSALSKHLSNALFTNVTQVSQR